MSSFSSSLERIQGNKNLLVDSSVLRKRAFEELMRDKGFADIYLSLQVQSKKRKTKTRRELVPAKKSNIVVSFSKNLYQKALLLYFLSKEGLKEKICDDFDYCEKVAKHGKTIRLFTLLVDFGTACIGAVPWFALAWALLKEETLDDMCGCPKRPVLQIENAT